MKQWKEPSSCPRNSGKLSHDLVCTVYDGDEELLKSTEDVVRWWKEYFKGFLDPTHTYSRQEVDHIIGAKAAEAVKQLRSQSAPGVDESCPSSSRL